MYVIVLMGDITITVYKVNFSLIIGLHNVPEIITFFLLGVWIQKMKLRFLCVIIAYLWVVVSGVLMVGLMLLLPVIVISSPILMGYSIAVRCFN